MASVARRSGGGEGLVDSEAREPCVARDDRGSVIVREFRLGGETVRKAGWDRHIVRDEEQIRWRRRGGKIGGIEQVGRSLLTDQRDVAAVHDDLMRERRGTV